MQPNKFELVHTVTDYYDGPRAGVADFLSTPHFYESEWSDLDNNYADTYLLTAISSETFDLAMESWAIWCRWKQAFDNRATTRDTHPAVPSERARHTELEEMLNERLVSDPDRAIRAKAIFRPVEKSSSLSRQPTALTVSWQPF